jgi:hypothetical protein
VQRLQLIWCPIKINSYRAFDLNISSEWKSLSEIIFRAAITATYKLDLYFGALYLFPAFKWVYIRLYLNCVPLFYLSKIRTMKTKMMTVLLMLMCITTVQTHAQEKEFITPTGVFDTVYDRFGDKHAVKDLAITFNSSTGTATTNTGKGLGASSQVNALTMCSAGFFDVYFANGSGMETNTASHIARRNTVCHVLENISGLLNWANWNSATRVNILIDDIGNYIGGPSTSGVLGVASSYYVCPNQPFSNIPGMVHSQVEKTILSKKDAWINVISAPMSQSSTLYYHGFMAFNFYNTSYIWQANYATQLASPTEIDLYTIVLHEMTHQLGFASLIGRTGSSNLYSNFFQNVNYNNNYYSHYDKFLHDKNFAPLLASSSGCSQQYGIQFTSNAGFLAPGCTNPYTSNLTTCPNAVLYNSSAFGWIPVYTPACFEQGSSLSHFEDMCYPSPNPANNDKYFVMSNAQGVGTNKRYLKPVERSVLCDLGYTVLTTYTSSALSAPFNYGGIGCTGRNLWGVNDGIGATGYLFTSQGGQILIPITGAGGVLSNDSPLATNIACVEDVYNSGTVAWPIGNNIVYTPNPGYVGPVLLRYIPRDAGNNEGNITYIYGYVFLPQCNYNACEMVQNGGFEFNSSCGVLRKPHNVFANCWMNSHLSPDLFVRGCTQTTYGSFANLGSNTFGSNPVYNSPYLPGNNAIAGFGAFIQARGTSVNYEEAFTKLRSPLVAGQTYQVGFWAYQYVGDREDPDVMWAPAKYQVNPMLVPATLSFRSSSSQVTQWQQIINPAPTFNTLIQPALNNSFNTWTYYSFPFTYNPANPNDDYLYVGVDINATAATFFSMYPGSGATNRFFVLMDDISITPMPVVIPAASKTLCIGSGIANLGQYAQTPGTFQGQGVTFSNNQYHFNQPATLGAGTYVISFNYIGFNNCSLSQTIGITLVTPPKPLLIAPTNTCSNAANVVLQAGGPPTALFTWQPGNLPNPLTLPPFSTGVYIVTGSHFGCSDTTAVRVGSNCCPGISTAPFEYTQVNGGSFITGPVVILNDITISGGPPNSLTKFSMGEFIMGPNVKITVSAGQNLLVEECHFRACGAMWKGFDVIDQGRITVNWALIEDAFTAVNLDTITTNHAPLPIEILGSVFNKNNVGINLSNTSITSLGITIENSVFTCRNLPYTAWVWPNQSQLRALGSLTTGLNSPYTVGGYGFTTMNPPLTGQISHCGIRVFEFGNIITGTGPGVQFGNNQLASAFNLFDGMELGIEVINGGLSIMNNVFQEMRRYQPPGATGLTGGTAIQHRISSDMNAELNLYPWGPPNTYQIDFGNRFWNNYVGVDAINVFRLNSTYSVFRSIQNSANITTFLPGNAGFRIITNRFKYAINTNDFNNIANAVDITLSAGTYNMGSGQQTGTYADNITINENYIDAEVSGMNPTTTEYVDKAISILRPIATGWVSTTGTGIFIQSNNVNRSYRGISIDGIQNYTSDILGNHVRLVDDNTGPNFQYGIQVKNTVNNVLVFDNLVQGMNPANQNMTLVYCENNAGTSGQSPQVLCNNLSQSYIAFDFNGANANTDWWGNYMTNHSMGLVLSANGIIGPQGGNGNPSDNQWIGGWPMPALHTMVRGGSDASFSPLYLQTTSPPWFPSNNGGPPILSYNAAGTWFITPGSYNCPPTQLAWPPYHRNGSVVDIEEMVNDESSTLLIYPNPASDLITVSGMPENKEYEIVISDVSGKTVYSNTGKKTYADNSFNLALAAGLYLVEVRTADGPTTIKKLVIANK